MAVGIIVPLPAYTLDSAFIANKAEELGFESIWYHEHPILPVHSDSPFPLTGGDIPETYRHFTDPFIALARASRRHQQDQAWHWHHVSSGTKPTADGQADCGLGPI